MEEKEFLEASDKVVKYLSNYFTNIEKLDVSPDISYGSIKNQIDTSAPEKGEKFEEILNDLDKIIIPGIVNWNHPNFLAYFNSTSSKPAVLGEFISASLNVNAIMWFTSKASSELEERMTEWLLNAFGLPETFFGIFYDTASVSSLHALATARYKYLNTNKNLNNDIRKLALYLSEHSHSSLEKAGLLLGILPENIIKIESDEEFRLNATKLEQEIDKNLTRGIFPFAIVGTIGTTSTASTDPIVKLIEIRDKYCSWLHIDAAYAGAASILVEKKHLFEGWELADSITVNPHKWLFVPVDLSFLMIKDKLSLKNSFSLIPEYLVTEQTEALDYMNYGIQLGRRFRSLKLWFHLRYYGLEKLREIIRLHISLAEELADRINKSPNFSLSAPLSFSLVCYYGFFSEDKEENNRLNKQLLNNINKSGKFLISHTILKGKYSLRTVFSGLEQSKVTLDSFWEFLNNEYKKILKQH